MSKTVKDIKKSICVCVRERERDQGGKKEIYNQERMTYGRMKSNANFFTYS